MIPGGGPDRHLSGIFWQWRLVRARAGLDDVRLHDLRHSFASRALTLGESLPMIARLLGHTRIQTTARYAHLARDAVKEAAARVAVGIGEDILVSAGSDPLAVPSTPATDTAADEAVKASAARIAAHIGEDILPMRTPGRDRKITK